MKNIINERELKRMVKKVVREEKLNNIVVLEVVEIMFPIQEKEISLLCLGSTLKMFHQ
jgi:hypothetical protein